MIGGHKGEGALMLAQKIWSGYKTHGECWRFAQCKVNPDVMSRAYWSEHWEKFSPETNVDFILEKAGWQEKEAWEWTNI